MGIKDSSLWAREILSFLETAKNGSINGTAEANAMKQSNLSRTLKSLEEKLKCQLLERGYNGVLPAFAAAWLYPMLHRFLF